LDSSARSDQSLAPSAAVLTVIFEVNVILYAI
jgi:hypothetical protein